MKRVAKSPDTVAAVLQAAAEAAAHGTCLSAKAKGSVEAYVGAEITIHNTQQCDADPEVTVKGKRDSSGIADDDEDTLKDLMYD